MTRRDLETFAEMNGIELFFTNRKVFIKGSSAEAEYNFMILLGEIVRNNPQLEIESMQQATMTFM
jgi:hypothetical protein